MQNSSAESGDTWWTVPAEGDGTPEVSLSLLCVLYHGHCPNAFCSEGSKNLEVVVRISAGYSFNTAVAGILSLLLLPFQRLKRLSLCTHHIAFHFWTSGEGGWVACGENFENRIWGHSQLNSIEKLKLWWRSSWNSYGLCVGLGEAQGWKWGCSEIVWPCDFHESLCNKLRMERWRINHPSEKTSSWPLWRISVPSKTYRRLYCLLALLD